MITGSMRTRKGVALTLSATLIGAATGTSAASAASDTNPSPGRGLDAPTPADRIDHDAPGVAVAMTGLEATPNDRVTLPRRASGAIDVRSAFDGPTLSIGLPDDLAGSSVDRSSTQALFASPHDDYEVVTEAVSTGARALIEIDGPDAPVEYHFEIAANVPTTLAMAPDGGVEVIDEHGEAVAYVAAPWAVDAAGSAVPTSFRVEGNTLIQTIEHRGASYPVTADPAVQHDCGWVTCTIRFDRDRTRWIADHAGSLSALSATVCAYAGGAAVPCAAAIIAIGWAVQTHARDYYNNGNCYGIRYPRAFPTQPLPPPHSHQVTEGTYNCHK